MAIGAEETAPTVAETSWVHVGRLLRLRLTWAMSAGFFGVIYMTWLYATWLPGYLEEQRHLSVTAAGLLTSIPLSAGFAGALIAGFVIQALIRTGRSPVDACRWPVVAAMLATAVFTVAGALVGDVWWAIGLLSAGVFSANLASSAGWALGAVIVPSEQVASLEAIQNVGGSLGGALAPAITGMVAQATGSFTPALMLAAAVALVTAGIYALTGRRGRRQGQGLRPWTPLGPRAPDPHLLERITTDGATHSKGRGSGALGPSGGSGAKPLTLASFLALTALASCARADAVGPAVRRGDWTAATAAAAGLPDPLAAKLVTYYRLLRGEARAAEIAAFVAGNPGWPAAGTLLKRRDEALASAADDPEVLPLCGAPAARSGAALARCADAFAAASRAAEAAAAARAAWIAGLPDPDSTARFLVRWGSVLGPADEAARFDALLGAGDAAGAAAQVKRLAPADAKIGRARLALRAGRADALALVDALPATDRYRPDVLVETLRALRRGNNDAGALALWRGEGFGAERAATPTRAGVFWAERSALARQVLRDGDAEAAFLLADDAVQTAPEQQADAAFLAGFIALRRLHRPDVAVARFGLLTRSTAAISQARAHYWRARALADRAADAAREYGAAAVWPTTYYGQLAGLAEGWEPALLSSRISALVEPGWTQAAALDFAGGELARAAAMLVAWGDAAQARPFLQQMQVAPADPATRALQARFALELGLPDAAVAAARRAGREGTVLAQTGWPMPVQPPDRPEPALALGIMRQESSFEVGAVSPSGARGLMQLMPATAAAVGGQIGGAVPASALTTDAQANMRLGSAYLGQLLGRFGGSMPLAIAAYNAGPNRVEQWLAENGDPRGHGAAAMIDWIELIPFSETRNYVQRVIENVTVYRARRGEVLPYPVGT